MLMRLGLGLGFTRGGAARNFAPTDIAWAGAHTVAENSALGTVVGGALSATDPDDVVTFSLVDDAGGMFGIGSDGTSIIITGVPDYETATSHNITVRATDSDGGVYDEVFAITVTDVSETPADDPLPEDGEVIVDDEDNFEEPPVIVIIDGGVTFPGKKKAGVQGKFIYDIGQALPDTVYTLRYDPDWSLLTNGGVTAMVAFGLRDGNSFRLSGLKGDGAAGLKAYELHGSGGSGWSQGSGHTATDGGAAAHGTQGGPNWMQFEVSADGTTYTMRTSADGDSWTDEFADVTPTPHADVDSVPSFGIAVLLEAADAGSFRVDITLWTEEEAVITDPHFASVVFLAGFEGADGATSYSEEKNSRAATFAGNAQIDTAQKPFGMSSIFFDGSGDLITFAANSDYRLSSANSSQFTIEGHVRFGTLDANSRGIMGVSSGVGGVGWIMTATAAGELAFAFSTDGSTFGTTVTTSGAGLTTGVWYYWAVSKNASGKIRVRKNGVMLGSATPANSAFFNAPGQGATLGIGAQGQLGTVDMHGWQKEIRITAGVDRYDTDSDVSVPDEAFPRA